MRVIELSGDPLAMGHQHAEQIRDLRPHIEASMERRLNRLAAATVDYRPWVEELSLLWEAQAYSTWGMMQGISEGLELDWGEYVQYVFASYLEACVPVPAPGEGCTTWAAGAPVTRDGGTMLVKNRDYDPLHQPLQGMAIAAPEDGYRSVYLTSAGSPGVFSSGMNAAGLAVADTHVPSQDFGPGLSRFAVMLELLNRFAEVGPALDYLKGVRHTGDGTLVLADRAGGMAVFEGGQSAYGVVRPERGYVVSTNHYVTEDLRDRWIERSAPGFEGNSQNRRTRVESALEAASGEVDAAWAQALMASHGEQAHCICRHPGEEPDVATISTAIYLTRDGLASLSFGQPCVEAFETVEVGRG